MRKPILIFILTFTMINYAFNQAPEIQWQNTIGGNSYDDLYSIEQTSDGGYILGGLSSSDISGDKTENGQGGYDYWVVKLNSSGSIEWQNTIGGTGNDDLYSVIQTTDGGYLLGGYSISGISGDKTVASKGGYDYWIVKLNSAGGIVWQKTYGGNGDDYLKSLQLTSDGGYILGGWSNSGVSGNKTENLIGVYDYWVIKINASGGIQWQNTIGGTSDDILNSVQQTADGGYILGGYSSSGISGDKTDAANLNVGGGNSSDFWVIKLNSGGSIEWQKTIGGNSTDRLFSIDLASDGGYILGGYSDSGISGDKSEAVIGGYDYWVVKINSIGNLEWENTIGGSNAEDLVCVKQTSDDGFIIGGYSTSNISGDKTENNIWVGDDYWILKLYPSGNIEWQKTIGGTDHDLLFGLQETSDGGFILAGWSQSGLGGNKTEESIGMSDYWIVKLEGNCVPETETCNGIDNNCNGLIDDGVIESININAGGTTTFCQGGSVILTASYTGTAVQWKKDGINITGATNSTYTATQKATYTCQTTSECGTALSTGIYVNVQKNPTAIITAGGSTTFCTGGSVTLTANAGVGLSYQWYKGAAAIAGATSINYVATTTGNYKCRVTKAATGCYKISNGIVVTVTCKEGENNFDINVFPNPTNNVFNISSNKIIGLGIITVTDINGKLIITDLIKQTDLIEVNLENFANGMYFIKIEENGNHHFYKIIKN